MGDMTLSRDSKYAEYEKLLSERDEVMVEADRIWLGYLRNFGKLTSDIYEEKLECIKCKKIIAYYQNAINHGGKVDSAQMEKFLNNEMAGYYAHLERLIKDNKNAQNAKGLTAYEEKRSKELYFRLVKLLHPDLHPETDRSAILQDLWQRIQIAYHQCNIKELSELEVLTRKALNELGIEGGKADIPDIDDKIEELKAEIYDITHTEPYILRYLMENEKAVEARTAELNAELEEYQEYHKQLEDVIIELVKTGGLKFYVKGK